MQTPKPVYRFPPGRNQLQSLLSSVAFLKDPIGVITGNLEKYAGTYSVALTGVGKLIVTDDPDFIQYVLRDNHSNYQKSEMSTKTAADLFGGGLLFSNGKPWLRQRRLIQPAFHHHKIKGLQSIVVKTVQNFLSEFPTGVKIDIYPLIHKLSFSILIHSLFDINIAEQTISELSACFTDLQDFLMKDINQPFRKLLYPINGKEKKIHRKSDKVRTILEGIIEERKNTPESHHDLLDMLLNSRYEDTGEPMERDQMIDEILVLLFAGHETTANTISWLLYLLAENPEIAEKLRQSTGAMSIFDSQSDHYFNAVISEAMRLYPAAWMTERVALTDDRFNDFSFPAGTIIIPFFYGLHRNKNYWKEESRFNPERFVFPDPAQLKKVKNFFPFGAGPRMCIGNNFAMMEMSIILHDFMSRFEITPAQDFPEMWPLITLRPRKVLLNINRRG